jgi:hypothetical protein
MNRKANNVLSPNLLSNLKKMNSCRYLKASQRELNEILISMGTHSQDEIPLFGVNFDSVNLLVTNCDQLRPILRPLYDASCAKL